MTEMPPPQTYVQPHRGVLILVFGILGIVMCFIFGIIAWVMGNNDLRAMRAGTMDQTGEQMTNAGRICGMIGTILAIISLGGSLLMLLIFIIIAAAEASM